MWTGPDSAEFYDSKPGESAVTRMHGESLSKPGWNAQAAPLSRDRHERRRIIAHIIRPAASKRYRRVGIYTFPPAHVLSLHVPYRPVTESAIALAGRKPAPDDARAADWDPGVDFHRHNSEFQGSSRVDYLLSDSTRFVSITSYSQYHQQAPIDVDGTDFNVLRNDVFGRISSFYQEVRADQDLKLLKVTLGGNYQQDHTYENQVISSHGSESGAGPFRYYDFAENAEQRAKTYAGFGNLDIPLTSELTLQGGARYTHQDRSFQGCLADAGDGELGLGFSAYTGNVVPPGGCITVDAATGKQDGATHKSLDQSNLSWRGSLNYKPTSRILTYVNVTKGYKSGAFTPLPAVLSTQSDPVTQESVLATEAGIKASLLDRMIDVTAAGFYYDYRDKQILGTGVFPPFGPLPQLVNIPQSSVRGAEVEIVARPLRGLRLSGGATYVNSRVDDHYDAPDPLGRELDLKGEAFPNTPRWQLIGDGEYDFPVSSALRGFFGGNASYRSTSNASFGENPIFVIKPYTIVGVRAGIGSTDNRWRLEVWGRNITNTFYWVDTSFRIDTIARTTGMPATYGMTIHTMF